MIKVIQIIDSLNAGGAERMAVNYANGLADIIEESHICITREEGSLMNTINPRVKYLHLNRNSTLDIKAIFKLKRYIAKQNINLVHAHSTSYFIACFVKLLLPRIKIVWHDHYGNSEFLDARPRLVLRFCSRFFSYIFSVNPRLAKWSEKNLFCKNIEYVKNFAVLNDWQTELTHLKGIDGKRVLCLANLREQKNHLRLLEAFKIVKNEYPEWSLHCVGKDFKDDYSKLFSSKIRTLGLEEYVYFYDSRSDILNILNQCNIGVLVSKSEGLPLAILEYGIAKLPIICTDVGYCGKLIPNENFGILLEDDNKTHIANAIIQYIEDEDYMNLTRHNYSTKIIEEYSRDAILNSISQLYKSIVFGEV